MSPNLWFIKPNLASLLQVNLNFNNELQILDCVPIITST